MAKKRQEDEEKKNSRAKSSLIAAAKEKSSTASTTSSGKSIDKSLPAKSTTASSASSAPTIDKSVSAKSSASTTSTPRDPKVVHIEVDPNRTVNKSRGREKIIGVSDTMTKAGYISRQAYSGLGQGLSGTEGFIRTAAAKELEQAKKASKGEKASDILFNNLFGGGIDTLKSAKWDKDASLGKNLMNTGGAYLDATGQFIQGLSGVEGIKNWLAGRALEKDAEKSGLSVEEQAALEENALLNNNKVAEAMALNEVAQSTEAARERMPWAVRAGGDIANVAAALVPSVAVGAATRNPNAARALMSSSAAGSQMMDAIDNGADIDKALRAGYASGATEYGLEGLFGGIPVLDTGEGLANKAITAGASKVLPQEALQAVTRFAGTKGGRWLAWAGRKLGEGVEEVASEALRPSIESIYKDKADIDPVTANSLAKSGGLGVAVAILLGGSPNNVRIGKDVTPEQLALADYALRMQMEEEYKAAVERGQQAQAQAVARQAAQEAAIFNEMRRNNATLRSLDIGKLTRQLAEDSQTPKLDTTWLAQQEQEWNKRHQPEEQPSGLDLMGLSLNPDYDSTPYMERRANEEAAGGYYRGRDVSLYPENIPPKPEYGLDLIRSGLDKLRPVNERLADLQQPAKEEAPTLSDNSILSGISAQDAATAEQLIEQNGARAVANALLAGVDRQKQMNGTQKYAALLAAEQLAESDPQTAEQLRYAVFGPADNAQALIERNGAEETAKRLLAVVESGRELNPTQIRAAEILAQELQNSNPTLAQQMENAVEPLANAVTGTENEVAPAVKTAEPAAAPTEFENDGLPVVNLERRNMGLNVPQGQGKIRERGFSNNTLQQAAEAGTVDSEIANAMYGNTYSTVTNDQTRATAVAAIDKYGIERIYNYLMSRGATGRSLGDKVLDRGNLNSVEFAAALELMRRYSGKGEYGQERALALADIVEAANTDAGRLIQFNKTLMITDPVMYVTYQTKKAKAKGVELSTNRKKVLSVIAKAVKAAEDGTWNGKLDFSGITDWNKTRGSGRGVGIVANPTPAAVEQEKGLTEKQAARVDRAAAMIHEMAGQTNYSESEWLAALGASCLSDAIPAKAESWIGAIRRINLLLNLKTTAIRNGGGNLLQLILENVADIPSAIIAAGLKGENNPGGMSSVRLGMNGSGMSGFNRGLATSWLAFQTGTLQQLNNRYSDMTEPGTRLGGSSENPLLQAFRFLDDLTSFSVSVLDTAFSTAREEQVKNQFADIINDSEYGELTEEMQKIAQEAGQRVTYTNDNPIKTFVTNARNLGRSLQRSNNLSTRLLGDAITTAFQMLMPFAGVTSTILHTGLSYSPVGFISGLVDLVGESSKAGSIKNLSFTDQRRIATKFGRAITGSLLSFAAMFAAAAGMASGREPDDEVEAAIWKMEGRNPYSIKIGKNWYDLSALGPAMGLVSVGATVFDELDGDISKENWWPILKGLMFNSTDIKLNDTLDDNLWESVKKAAGYVGDKDWKGLLQYMVGQIAGQFTPFGSLLRAVTYGQDPYVRETSAKGEWGWLWRRWKSGIPGLSETLPTSMDVMGNPRERYPNADTDFGRWVNALFNPAAKISEDRSDDPVVQELARLMRETGDEDLAFTTAPYKLSAGGKDKYALYGEERSAYQQTRGTEMHDYLAELFGDSDYKALSTEEKQKLVNNILDLTEYDAKQTVADKGGGYVVPDTAKGSKLSATVKEVGKQGIDLPTYLIYNIEMDKDYALRYQSADEIPVYVKGDKKGQPKAQVGDKIDSCNKKGSALAIKQKFGDTLTADQMYYLWTLENDDTVEVKNGGTDNDYYRYFANDWDEKTLRNL